MNVRVLRRVGGHSPGTELKLHPSAAEYLIRRGFVEKIGEALTAGQVAKVPDMEAEIDRLKAGPPDISEKEVSPAPKRRPRRPRKNA